MGLESVLAKRRHRKEYGFSDWKELEGEAEEIHNQIAEKVRDLGYPVKVNGVLVADIPDAGKFYKANRIIGIRTEVAKFDLEYDFFLEIREANPGLVPQDFLKIVLSHEYAHVAFMDYLQKEFAKYYIQHVSRYEHCDDIVHAVDEVFARIFSEGITGFDPFPQATNPKVYFGSVPVHKMYMAVRNSLTNHGLTHTIEHTKKLITEAFTPK